MTMAARNLHTAITLTKLLVSFLSLIGAYSADSSCPGPIQYYEALECTPVFKNPDAPCPVKYNCDYLKNLPTDKCYVNGHEYAINDTLKEEDANPCDIGCTCSEGYRGADFTCAAVDCFHGPIKPECYRKNSPLSCCPDEEICPENPEDRPTCNVDGKIYKDGEYFEVESEPDLNCVCQEGYRGENIEPFCALPKRKYCGGTMRNLGDIRDNCAPVYYSNQSPQTGCSVFSRCQNDKDAVITGTTASPEESTDPSMMCSFGNLTMRLGDELNQATDYSSVCVKCVCEVPPVPTCQRLEECDVTNHPPFDFNN